MRRVAAFLFLAALVVVLPTLFVLGMAATERGTNWLIGGLARMLPDSLTVGASQGALLSDLELMDTRVESGDHRLTIARLRLRWTPESLFSGWLSIDELGAEGVRYTGPATTPSGDRHDEPAGLSLPIGLQIRQLAVNDAVLAMGEDRHLINHASLAATWNGEHLLLERLRIETPQVNGAAAGRVQTTPPHTLSVGVRWDGTAPQGFGLEGRGRLGGDMDDLQIDLGLLRPFSVAVRGDVRKLTALALSGGWNDLHWPPGDASEPRSPSGTFRIDGTLEQFRVDLAADVTGTPVTRLEATLDGGVNAEPPHTFESKLDWQARLEDGTNVEGTGRAGGDPSRIGIEHRLTLPFELSSHGTLWPPDARFELAGEWRNMRWPMNGVPDYRSPRGAYEAKGKPEDWTLALRGDADGAQLPTAGFRVEADGGATGARLRTLDLSLLGGQASIQGTAQWSPHPSWDLTLALRDLAPGRHWPDWTGRLAADAHTTGRRDDRGLRAEVNLSRLSGVLRDYPVEGDGRLSIDDRELRVHDLRMQSGPNLIEISGAAGDALDLHATLNASDLSAVWPGLAGNAEGAATITGRKDDPGVEVRLTGKGLRFGAQGIDEVSLDVRHQPASTTESELRFGAQRIRLAGERLDTLSLTAEGTLNRHRAELTAEGAPGRIQGRLAGGVVDGQWLGSLSELTLERTALRDWALSEPVSFRLGSAGGQLGRACIAQSQARLCGSGSWGEAGGNASAQIEDFPLSLAQPWLPDDVALQGAVGGDLEMTWGDAHPKGRIELVIGPGRLSHEADPEAPLSLDIVGGRLRGDLSADILEATVEIDLGKEDRARGRLRMGPEKRGRPLDGTIQIAFSDLEPLGALVPALQQARGRVTVDAALSGTATEPKITGNARLAGGAATLADLGVVVEEISLDVSPAADGALAVSGSAASGPGTLSLAGEVSPGGDWPATMHLSGRDFEAVRLPEAQALIEPDLTIRHEEAGVSVSGTLKIPRAKIVLKSPPEGVVKVSPDAVIIGDSASPSESSGVPLDIDAAIVLGERVELEAFGLETRLQGRIDIREISQRGAPEGYGQLEMKEGRYRAYGQDLTIERGFLIFSGPLDNPTLDLSAVRKAGDVTAGLEVSGPLRKPSANLFSRPAMEESDTLSYLLTGRPAGTGGSGHSALLTQAAYGFGLQQADDLARDLGASIGVDELGIGGDGDLETSSLVMGKYLTPSLYVRYVQGLFEPTAAIQLQYDISKHLRIETESGDRQQVEIIYKLERD